VNALNPQVEGMLCVYPNAGCPTSSAPMTSRRDDAKLVKGWAENGWLNVVGGCCGTTPATSRRSPRRSRDVKPRQWHALPPALRLSGMEAASFF
jgi:5-methyltetrahydrofolate--homocysteine methyltransferase